MTEIRKSAMISDGSACDIRSEVGFGEAIGDRRLNGTEG